MSENIYRGLVHGDNSVFRASGLAHTLIFAPVTSRDIGKLPCNFYYSDKNDLSTSYLSIKKKRTNQPELKP